MGDAVLLMRNFLTSLYPFFFAMQSVVRMSYWLQILLLKTEKRREEEKKGLTACTFVIYD